MINKIELNNLKFYISEKERLMKEINDLNSNIKDGYTSLDFTYSKGGKVSSDGVLNIVLHNMKYEKQIKKRIKQLERVILKIYKIIDRIDEPKIKAIVELRAINGKKWEEIGDELKYDSSYCRKIYVDYINN